MFCFGKKTKSCVGFVTVPVDTTCILSNPANFSEITATSYLQITDNQSVFIRKRNEKPDVYLPLEPENITGTTIVGEGVTGTLVNDGNIQVQNGKVMRGLHFSNQGRISLDGSVNDCFSHMPACEHGISLSMWMKPSVVAQRHLTHSSHSINVVISSQHEIRFWVQDEPNRITGVASTSTAEAGQWMHVTITYTRATGAALYINGVLEIFHSVFEPHSYPSANDAFFIGAKIGGQYPFNGIIDEFKIFYKTMSSSGDHFQTFKCLYKLNNRMKPHV